MDRCSLRTSLQGNETDWKLIGIDVNDPLAPLLNSKSEKGYVEDPMLILRVVITTAYQDVEKYRPGVVQAYRDWFTVSILVEFAKAYQSLTSAIVL